MKTVRFNIPNGGYNPGEIAGFDDKIADRLIKWGIAVEHKPKKQKTESKPEKKPEPKTESSTEDKVTEDMKSDVTEEKPKSNRGRKRTYTTKVS